MNILLLSIGYPPQSVGGTEIYVQSLAHELIRQGHKVTVVIPSEKETAESDTVSIVYEMTPDFFSHFISETQFDVVHGHPLIASRCLDYLQFCRQQEIPIVITYHTPTLSCGRGDLLFNGEKLCDGEIRLRRCTACVFQQKGLPIAVGRILAALPGLSALERFVPIRKLRSMFAIPRQLKCNSDLFQQLMEYTYHWVAVSQGVKNVLTANRIPAERITLCRQAFCHEQTDLIGVDRFETDLTGEGLRVAFIGRIHPDKGLHVLLKALHYLPSKKIHVYIVGDRRNVAEKYLELLEKASNNDPRVTWMGRLEPGKIPVFLKKMDVLVVPSLWMETGPMTVLEAWAVGIPVIGSDRGGIKEWIETYGGGWLFPPGNSIALAELLIGLTKEDFLSVSIPKSVDLPSMQEVTRMMVKIYQAVCLPQADLLPGDNLL